MLSDIWPNRKKLYCGRISAVTLGFESLQKVPQGGWQKASDTTLLLQILESFCADHVQLASEHEILRWTVTATSNLNFAMRTLFRSGLWMTRMQARDASVAGINFLKSYSRLAALTLAANRDGFPITPKAHFLHHLFHELKLQGAQHSWSLNCLGTSVQMDEEPCVICSSCFFSSVSNCV